jgi:hypothetical protein
MNVRRIFFIVIITCTIFCCNKSKLDQPALGFLNESDLSNKSGVEGLLIGAYAVLDGYSNYDPDEIFNLGKASSNWIFGSICGGEAYKGSNLNDQTEITSIARFEATAYSSLLGGKWRSLYDGIARANTVIRMMRKAKDMLPEDTLEVRAEAVFLRALFHFEAKKIWNNIQIIDENISYETGNFFAVANDTSWSLIENDLIFSSGNLPEIQKAPGRVNKYAAKAFLAKAYLFEHKYKEAEKELEEIINSGVTSSGVRYQLEKHYEDNFHPSGKNGSESVFAFQSSVDAGGDGFNGNIGDHPNYPWFYPGGWEFFHPSQFLVNHFKTDPITGLPDLDHFNDVPVKSDQGISADEPFEPDTATLDPRLDWTVSRRGIPFLDYGIDQGLNLQWRRNQDQSEGPYIVKKNIIFNSEIGNYAPGSWDGNTFTANNINYIRYADILLWAAEVEAELGDLQKATNYVNQIRARAADPSGWVYKYNDDSNPANGYSGTYAANYKVGLYPVFPDKDYALKAIRFERALELGMEGHRFFDLVRWGIAEEEIGAFLSKDQQIVPAELNGAFFRKGYSEHFPIPQSEISLTVGSDGIPKMKQNPGY